jgi:hypothetical protein
VLPQDVRDLARDVLRHRMVLTYEALADGVDADRVLDGVLERVPMPAHRPRRGTMRSAPGDELPRAPRADRARARPRSHWSPTGGAQRRRRRFAVRYPAVGVLAGVAGRSWGRHVPALLVLLAIAALAVALARPQHTVAAEQDEAIVVMVTDTSGSMRADDVKPIASSRPRGPRGRFWPRCPRASASGS